MRGRWGRRCGDRDRARTIRGSGGSGFGCSALFWTTASTSPDSLGWRLQAFFFAEELEAFTLEFQPRLLQFVRAHLHNGGRELADGVEPRLEFLFRHGLQVLQKAGVVGEEHDVQLIGGYASSGELAGVLGNDAGFVEKGIEREPFLVSAGAPFREVAIGNWAAFELFGHDFHDLRVRVQPFDEAICRLAIGEAAVELLPDVERDSRNLSVTRFHIGFLI